MAGLGRSGRPDRAGLGRPKPGPPAAPIGDLRPRQHCYPAQSPRKHGGPVTEPLSFPKNKNPGQTWEETLTKTRQWQSLPKQQRATFLTQARKRDKAERISRQIIEGQAQATHREPEETPFSIPDGMTPEQATIEKIRRDAETWPITSREHEKPEVKAGSAERGHTQKTQKKEDQDVFRGPRGGKYRVDNNGKKRYDIG